MKQSNYFLKSKGLIFRLIFLSLLLICPMAKASTPPATPVYVSVSPINHDLILVPGQHKCPPCVPTIILQGHTLSFSYAYVDWELQLWQNGMEVYSETLTSSSQVVLPSYLVGDYELRIVGSTYYLHGNISLGDE